MLMGLSNRRHCFSPVYLGCELPRWGRAMSFDRWPVGCPDLLTWPVAVAATRVLNATISFNTHFLSRMAEKLLAGSSENSDNLAYFKLYLFKATQHLVQTLTFFSGWVKRLSSKNWQKENKTNRTVVLWKHKDFFYLSLKDRFLHISHFHFIQRTLVLTAAAVNANSSTNS